ncbi:MAG: hypothetical protein WD491_07140 [Balneolales bacterium]
MMRQTRKTPVMLLMGVALGLINTGCTVDQPQTAVVTQPEVYAWSNFNGIRVDGHLMEFTSSLRVTDPNGKDIARSAKEQQLPSYERDGKSQIITTELDSLDFKQTVTETGSGSALVEIEALARSDREMGGAYFALKLPASHYGVGEAVFSGSEDSHLSLANLGTGETRVSANRIYFNAPDYQIDLILNEPTEVILRNDVKETGNILVYIPVITGDAEAGQRATTSFTLTATGKIDRTPSEFTLNTSEVGREFHGLGGNFRLQNPNTDPQVIDYNIENMRVAWTRFEMPWRQWHPDQETDPYEAAMAGDIDPHVEASMEIAQRMYERGKPVMLASWSGPDWAIEGPYSPGLDEHGQRGNPLDQDNINQIYESITAYILYLKDHYGVETKYYSFNESDLGIYIRQTPEEHAEFIKGLGAYMESKNLDTKVLLGDTSDANAYAFLNAAMDDPEARQYMGPVSFHSWRGWSDETLQKWADAAERMDLPLIVGEGSIDAAGWRYPTFFEEPLYALEEVDVNTKILKINQPMSILQWQLTADYSVLSGGGVFGNDEEPLYPTQRFWNLKQHSATPKDVNFMPITGNRDDVTSAAMGDNERGAYAIHLVNNGATHPAILTGLPDDVEELKLYVTDQNREMEEHTTPVTGGQARFTLHAASYTSLITDE